jgi:hypothetical protein
MELPYHPHLKDLSFKEFKPRNIVQRLLSCYTLFPRVVYPFFSYKPISKDGLLQKEGSACVNGRFISSTIYPKFMRLRYDFGF